MTARNTSNGKRFVVRTPKRKSEPHFVIVDASDFNPSLKQSARTIFYQTQQPSSAPMASRTADASTSQGDGAPSRRVVVVRNPNNPNVHQGPVDLNEFERGNSFNISPAISDGHKSVYLIRRPIAPTDPIKPVETEESMEEPRVAVSPTASVQPSRTPTPPKTKIASPTSPVEYQSPSPSPPKRDEVRDNRRKRNNVSPIITANTNDPRSPMRKKSAKSIVFVNPADQSIAVVENSFVKGESLRPVMMKRPKSIKRTRFEDHAKYESTDKLVKTPRPRPCLDCLSRHMCLIIIICVIVVVIGFAGIGVSAYYLATGSTNESVPQIVGVAVGGVLVIGAMCFLCILLACIGSRYGYFSDDTEVEDDENTDTEHSRVNKGRALALISPAHPNAHLYIPRDYMQMMDNPHSNSFVPPTSAVSSHHQQAVYRSTTSARRTERKSGKPSIVIEMPERLLTGRKISPRSRERSLNKVVKNIGPIVEDARKHCNGDLPSKVIVKVEKPATSTT